MDFGVSRLEGLLGFRFQPVQARLSFLRAIAEECPSRECAVYSSFHLCESETNGHVVIGIGLREGCKRVLVSFGVQFGWLWAKELKLSLLRADPEVWRKRCPIEAVS
jgi:hypothetical protein